MSFSPETRNSLILRLPDRADIEAWDEFVEVYQPLVYRLARHKGFQDADAQEIVQEVLVAVSRAVERWVPDKSRGRFRDWLFRISRNLMINYLTRKKYRSLAGSDSELAMLLDIPCNEGAEESTLFALEYRREVFRWAAQRVRREVKETTWEAFWRTSVQLRPVSQVAQELGMTVGAVYIARSRVMAKLRETGNRFELSRAEEAGERR